MAFNRPLLPVWLVGVHQLSVPQSRSQHVESNGAALL